MCALRPKSQKVDLGPKNCWFQSATVSPWAGPCSPAASASLSPRSLGAAVVDLKNLVFLTLAGLTVGVCRCCQSCFLVSKGKIDQTCWPWSAGWSATRRRAPALQVCPPACLNFSAKALTQTQTVCICIGCQRLWLLRCKVCSGLNLALHFHQTGLEFNSRCLHDETTPVPDERTWSS